MVIWHELAIMSTFFSWLGTFFTGALSVWIAQAIISYRERHKKITETNLSLYMSWMPHIAEWYVEAISPTCAFDEKTFLKKKFEILGILQIMGPTRAMMAFFAFSEMAELAFKKDPTFNKEEFFEMFTNLNASLCCEIHGEGPNEKQFAKTITKVLKQVRRGSSSK